MDTRNTVASIITIGDELLIGQTVDTNSAWMAQELNAIGVWVHRRVSVGDDRDAIWQALDEESKHARVILITGGLGPTADDITKPLLCQYFGGRMVVDEGALANVRHIFQMLNRPLIERNLKQAEVPDVCTVIQNRRGTAPGMWFEKEGVVFVSMPGVPHEMKGMMKGYVIPALQDRFRPAPILHRTLLTAGIGESFLAERIKEFESTLPRNIKLAYLPSYGMVKLRLTGRGDDPRMEAELQAEFDMLRQLVEDVLVTDEDKGIPQVVGEILSSRGQTLSTIESCTGGYIGHLITSVPGSSRYYLGGAVAYSNTLKMALAGVRPDTLSAHGAVSRETVLEMANGIRDRTGSDFAIATSGIMGPDGGTPDKPVGTVWVGLAAAGREAASHFQFRFDRQRNTELAATHGLNALRKFILV
ncbi:MAG: CinA family nicotinamide mononucleotide deamidase-related protein [Chitinophagia bacterium]|nr:CinA family nicotinamide mononucleotide deamidase-related protein [Chitinophagia bacterium]